VIGKFTERTIMDVTTFYNIGSLINVFILILVFAAGIFVIKGATGKALSEAQSTTISTLREEIDSLRGQIGDVRAENQKLELLIFTLVETMKKLGYEISVDGSIVHIKDVRNNADTSIRIPPPGIGASS
jgi:hypothetical protein